VLDGAVKMTKGKGRLREAGLFQIRKKKDGTLHPGPQQVDPDLWAELELRAAKFRQRQKNELLV
jgi:hypothetical protein